jgi:hypothetical protein
MIDAGDFDAVLLYLVDDDIWREDQFAPSIDAAGATPMGKLLECRTPVIDGFHDFASCSGVVFCDALKYAL